MKLTFMGVLLGAYCAAVGRSWLETGLLVAAIGVGAWWLDDRIDDIGRREKGERPT